jgi:predicted transcriptional regulator/transcriptional regulator with XRE-family HTH domain
MAVGGERKLFLGAGLKRIRRDLGVTQMRMAEDLGVSASYLNLLERNQRPVTAQVLMRLAETYDLDLRSLSSDPEGGGAEGLGEVFADPLFRDLTIARHELSDVAENAPAIAEAVSRLYRAYMDGRRAPASGGAGLLEAATVTPSDWVRDFIQAQRNHFPELEERAEALAGELHPQPQDFAVAARERLASLHRIEVRVAPLDVLSDSQRRYDHHRKRLYLSEILTASGRAFALAYQLGLLEHGDAINAIAARANPPDAATRSLLRVSLANYLAAAVLMPYAAFHEVCERNAYDLDLARARFGVSYEQACHRLTTLARPGARGVPFFMMRVDCAGNISKRFASAAFPFSRFGGACPRWNLHTCFQTPGRVVTQIVETLDGARFFTFSRTVQRAAGLLGEEASDLAIGLGCELRHANRLAYARGLDLASPKAVGVGPACRICERAACPQRASEPVNRTLMVDDFSKSVSPYPFSPL